MDPKKVPLSDSKPKRTINVVSIETKREIISKVEKGMKVAVVAKQYNLPRTTVSTYWNHRHKIIEATVLPTMSHAVSAKQRPHALNEMEKLLLLWINEKQRAGDNVDQNMICEKAKEIYINITKDDGEKIDFLASLGWLRRFRRRHGVHSVFRHGEAVSANKKAADEYVQEFGKFIETQGFVSSQIFNCNETGLFWKKMPKRTYITAEETALPGHKPMKDRLTLLLCSNATGDFKVKPLLVYHSENPRAFKRFKVCKESLPVMWRSNTKSWVTRVLFLEWVSKMFAPMVKKYLEEKGLPLRCVLVLDNAPAYPPDLGAEFGWITVKHLPPNTSSLIRPMGQFVITNFKKLYTKHMLQKCFDITNSNEMTLKNFWKNCYNIYQAVHLIDKAWTEVTRRTLNSTWKKLLPSAVFERDFGKFETEQKWEEESVMREILDLCNNLHLEANADDVEELVDAIREDLTTEDLQQLQEENQRTKRGQIMTAASEGKKEEEKKAIMTDELKQTLCMCRASEFTTDKFHSNETMACSVINAMNDSIMPFLKNLLRNWKEQIILNSYFRETSIENTASDEPQPGPSGIKKMRRETTLPSELPSTADTSIPLDLTTRLRRVSIHILVFISVLFQCVIYHKIFNITQPNPTQTSHGYQ